MADTKLRRIRIDDELWEAAEEPCARLDPAGKRSGVARSALLRAVAYDKDPLLKKVLRIAQERGTTVEQVERDAIAQYLKDYKKGRAVPNP